MKAKLNNSILGWMLVPLDEEAIPVLDLLYGTKYNDLKPTEKAFMSGEPIADALAHVKSIAKTMNIRVSACGNPASPTLRFWHTPPAPTETPVEHHIDLRYSLWTTDDFAWEQYAPGVLDKLQKAFEGTGPAVTVYTGPKKELRYGKVTFRKGNATGSFTCEWDDAPALADTLNTTDDDAFRESIPFSTHSNEPGVDKEFCFDNRSFYNVMKRVNDAESDLIRDSERQWKEVEEMYTAQTTADGVTA